MKLKFLVIPIACATFLGVLLGWYSGILSRGDGAAKAARDQKIMSQSPQPAALHPHSAAPAAGAMGEAAATRPQASAQSAAPEAHILKIRPEYLSEAERMADDMAANLKQYQLAMGETAYFNQSLNAENPARKLALRLGMDEDSAKKAETLLSAHLAQQIKLRLDAEKDRMEREGRLLGEDRGSYVIYLAIQSMAARGETLSAGQQAFFEKIRGTLGHPDAVVAKLTADHWYENPALVEAISQELPAGQQTGLASYVEEQTRRAQEVLTMHAYMRSNMIAERLGLDDADRTALYEYLHKHPGASRSDVSKIISPELMELLPEGM